MKRGHSCSGPFFLLAWRTRVVFPPKACAPLFFFFFFFSDHRRPDVSPWKFYPIDAAGCLWETFSSLLPLQFILYCGMSLPPGAPLDFAFSAVALFKVSLAISHFVIPFVIAGQLLPAFLGKSFT